MEAAVVTSLKMNQSNGTISENNTKVPGKAIEGVQLAQLVVSSTEIKLSDIQVASPLDNLDRAQSISLLDDTESI